MLLDSNILIYAAQPKYGMIRRFIAEHSPAVSVISQIEVLGYHRLRDTERAVLETLFAAAEILPLNETVIAKAISLRQQRKMSLGDSVLAGTALAYGRMLVTNNVEDFLWIPEIALTNPVGGSV